MLQLYSFQLCPFAHRVRLALAEKGVAVEQVEIDLKKKPADFATISPHGTVPLLRNGEAKLWESAVINEYLDEVFPDPPLMPASPFDRALVRIWVKFADERLYAPTHRFIFTRETEERRALASKMADSVRFLEAELMARRKDIYSLGEHFTLADIALFPWFEQVDALEQLSEFKLPAGCPGLSEWRRAVSERAAVRRLARTADWYVKRYRNYLAA